MKTPLPPSVSAPMTAGKRIRWMERLNWLVLQNNLIYFSLSFSSRVKALTGYYGNRKQNFGRETVPSFRSPLVWRLMVVSHWLKWRNAKLSALTNMFIEEPQAQIDKMSEQTFVIKSTFNSATLGWMCCISTKTLLSQLWLCVVFFF